jgi:hypothetical protein
MRLSSKNALDFASKSTGESRVKTLQLKLVKKPLLSGFYVRSFWF